MNEWYVGAVGAAILVVVFAFGFDMGKTKAQGECDAFGKFENRNVIYVCQREPKKG